MNEQNPQQPAINPVRVDAMIRTLEQQRDLALRQCVVLAAELACAHTELAGVHAKLSVLQAELAALREPAAPADSAEQA